jgi:hypothetical protein
MSLETTTQTMNSYLDALLNGGDFGRFFTDNVRWTTMETGDEIQGREAVRDFIVALHKELFDAKPEVRSVGIADGMAALEADFVGVCTRVNSRASHLRAPRCACHIASSMTLVRRASLPSGPTCQ